MAELKLPRVMIMQPSFTEGRPLDLRVLGVQFWISNQLAGAGFQAACVMLSDPKVTDEKRLAAARAPTEDEAASVLASTGCKFALHVAFDTEPGLRVANARVFSTTGRAAKVDLKGRNDALAPTTLKLFAAFLRAIGFKVETAQWHEVFGTRDTSVADRFLMVLGAHAMADQGFRVEPARQVLGEMRALIAGGLVPAIQVFPHLVQSLRRSGSLDDDALREEVRATLAAVKRTPGDWMAMLADLGVTRDQPS